MTNNNQERLFAEFPEVSTEKWEAAITADLKGADYERKLVWRTNEGFNVRPYYRAENLAGINFLESEAGKFPYVRGTRKHNRWRIHQSICVKDVVEANALALELISKRVDSVGFTLKCEAMSAEQLETLLRGIDLLAIEVVFNGCNIAHTAELFIAKVSAEVAEADRKKVHASFGIDPMVKNLSVDGAYCCSDSEGKGCYSKIAALMTKAVEFKHIRIATVNAQYFGNSGSTIVEELAFALAAGHDYLVKLTSEGVAIDTVARKMRFSFSVSSNYFMEMAKFRAARMLWANIVSAYNPERECCSKMYTHAVTSSWNQTAYDPYVNMLRGTTEAMSAAIAGVHSLEVLPFDASFKCSDDFSRRIARNTELLLKCESHFDQVVDPAGGSYYIENLTQSIAAEAWKLFQQVEDMGGYTEAFKAGFIVEKVEASAAAKDKNIATRRKILLGANQYPNFTEIAGEELTAEAVTRAEAKAGCLNPYRGAMSFEAMRFGADKAEKEPMAFMLTCGNLGMARARSQFACNFFACAGIRVVDNTYFKTVEQGVEAAVAAGADIVVVCSSDDDYATVAPEAKALLAGRATLVVAGAPACAEELQAQGITNFISVKSNVLETLKSYLKEMGI